jgi:hypothetical protein
MKRAKLFSRAPSVASEAPEREPRVEAMRKGRIVHGASLTQFLFFCKRLPSEPFPFGHLNPKAVCSKVAFIRPARDYERHPRTVAAFQIAEVAIPSNLFTETLRRIARRLAPRRDCQKREAGADFRSKQG